MSHSDGQTARSVTAAPEKVYTRAMKRTRQCPKCQSRRIGYLANLHDSGHRGPSVRRVGQMAVGSFLGARMTQSGGEIEGYLCTDCGYLEEYVKQPHQLNWAAVTGFQWVNSPPGYAPR